MRSWVSTVSMQSLSLILSLESSVTSNIEHLLPNVIQHFYTNPQSHILMIFEVLARSQFSGISWGSNIDSRIFINAIGNLRTCLDFWTFEWNERCTHDYDTITINIIWCGCFATLLCTMYYNIYILLWKKNYHFDKICVLTFKFVSAIWKNL